GMIIIVAVAAGIVAWPAWDPALLASGAYKYAPYMSTGDLETTLRAGRLEYYKEGAAATVSVRRLAGTRSLAIDGKVDASIVGDGRSHLLLTRHQYDVIVSEPSNPWMAGVAALFTREFFEAARARLQPDGVLCQWAHTYDISNRDLRSIVRTFASVFPQGTMWLVGEGDLLLVGANGDAIAPRLAALPDGCRKGAT